MAVGMCRATVDTWKRSCCIWPTMRRKAGRYLPAFRRIVGQMQHDLFHVYTVDQHILTVLRNVRRLRMLEFAHEYPLCSRLIASLERHWLLYIAAIFHDIAKGRGGDHSQLGRLEARRFCREHGLAAEDMQLVEFLVEHHLTMSSVAQKQDLSDPEFARRFPVGVPTERLLLPPAPPPLPALPPPPPKHSYTLKTKP